MESSKLIFEAGWRSLLESELAQPKMKELFAFLKNESLAGKTIYPEPREFFLAFDSTPFDQVKVVILGQDPYHGPDQAHGLCFSVKPNVPPPPSLVNIYKELKSDLGIINQGHGYLQSWANQGVLLLNSVMSVEAEKPASHRNKGWETFTDRVIQLLSLREKPMVFLLWGSYAQKKASFVDRKKHLVLEAPHPSPLSAHRGFLGCRHFSQANEFLKLNQIQPIDWQLPSLAEVNRQSLKDPSNDLGSLKKSGRSLKVKDDRAQF